MKKQILNDLKKLEQENVITSDVAQDILNYYKSSQQYNTNRLRIIFSLLGGCLIGLGMILIVAHNWDQITRPVKVFLAFVPMIIGHAVGFYVLLKKRNNISWREGSATFLFFAVGACIALIAQIYHIPGNMSNYLFTWMILILPLIFLLKSSMVSLLYLIGISWFVGETSYWGYGDASEYFYWILLIAVIPDYIILIKTKPESNFTQFLHWFIILSTTFSLGMFGKSNSEWLYVAYIGLFGVFYELGNHRVTGQCSLRINSYQLFASLGSVIVLLILGFDWFWKSLFQSSVEGSDVLQSREFLVSAGLIVIATVLMMINDRKRLSVGDLNPLRILPYFFLVIFCVGYINVTIPQILINVYVLVLGLYYLLKGSKSNQLGLLNYGLLILTALIVCRFFDADIKFVIRGLMFIVVGLGFFIFNYRILKKRRDNEI